MVSSVDTKERPTLTAKSPSNADVEPSSMGDLEHSHPVPGTSSTWQSAGGASVATHSADDYDVGVPNYELPSPSIDVLSIAGEIQEADDIDKNCVSAPSQGIDGVTVLNKCPDSSLEVASTPSFTTEKKNPTASKSTVRKATPYRRLIVENVTPKQGTMDSFLEKFKRKLSPDKESDGHSSATKQIRNNEPDK